MAARTDNVASDGKTKEAWNKSKGNMFRTLAALWAFAVMGMHGPAFGALLPYIAAYYKLDFTVLSLIFLPNLCGYVAAATTTGAVHSILGRRGIAIIGPLCMIAAYLVASGHPPFVLVVVALAVAGYGIGLQDASWNAYIGDLANPNQVVGILHGVYGLGAIVGPFVATVMVTRAGLSWYDYYHLMLAMSCLLLLITAPSFWTSSGLRYRTTHAKLDSETASNMSSESSNPSIQKKQTLSDILFHDPHTSRVIFRVTLFIMAYGGIEATVAGWTTTYMLQARHADALSAGMVISAFWLGLCSGRVILGFVTARIGEGRAIATYACIAVLLQGLFWLLPGVGVAAVIVALQGFFLGPMFPTGVVVLTSQLPAQMHVQGLATVCTCGAMGATVFPFAVGCLATKFGISVLVPILLGLMTCMLCAWLAVASATASRASEDGEREPLLAGLAASSTTI